MTLKKNSLPLKISFVLWGILISVCFISTFLHEFVGHGLIGILGNGEFQAFSINIYGTSHTYIASPRPTSKLFEFIYSGGGIVVNFFIGIIAFLLLKQSKKPSWFSIFCLLLMFFNLVGSFLYIGEGSLANIGDLKSIYNLLSLPRIVEVLLGIVSLFFAFALVWKLYPKVLDELSYFVLLETKQKRTSLFFGVFILFTLPAFFISGLEASSTFKMISKIMALLLLIFIKPKTNLKTLTPCPNSTFYLNVLLGSFFSVLGFFTSQTIFVSDPSTTNFIQNQNIHPTQQEKIWKIRKLAILYSSIENIPKLLHSIEEKEDSKINYFVTLMLLEKYGESAIPVLLKKIEEQQVSTQKFVLDYLEQFPNSTKNYLPVIRESIWKIKNPQILREMLLFLKTKKDIEGLISCLEHQNKIVYELATQYLSLETNATCGRIKPKTTLAEKDKIRKKWKLWWEKQQKVSDFPVAQKIVAAYTIHQETKTDSYFWMGKDKKKLEQYIQQENKYAQKVLVFSKKLQEKLFNEMKSRYPQVEKSVPYKSGTYYYYIKYGVASNQYPVCYRKKETLKASEELILDVNQLAKGHPYYHFGGFSVSPNQELLAFSVDETGKTAYTIYFKDLKSKKILKNKIQGAKATIKWGNDNKTIFYKGSQNRIYRYQLNSEQTELIYQEKSKGFFLSLEKNKSKKFILLSIQNWNSREYRFLNINNFSKTFKVFSPREKNHTYFVYDGGNEFYIRTNKNAKNFKLMKTSFENTEKENWKEVIPHREEVFLENVEVFQDYLVLKERKKGLPQIRIIDRKSQKEETLMFNEPVYDIYIHKDQEFQTKWFRYTYMPFSKPPATYDYNMEKKKKILRKQRTILGNFNATDYQCERLFVTASDGVQIPISILYKKGMKKNGKAPLLLQGYGGFSINLSTKFNPSHLSLLDRGFILALAHIRGGAEMGKKWHEDGKLLKKKNTFDDFILCSEFLIQEKYTSKKHLYAWGSSLGGLLMGVILNETPELYHGIIADVPLADLVLYLAKPIGSIIATELGHPKNKVFYKYLLSYSPYENIKAQNYPHLLVTAGLYDRSTPIWNIAKWVAKLRASKTDQNLLILQTDMKTGHFGSSDFYGKLAKEALKCSFLLDLEGITQ